MNTSLDGLLQALDSQPGPARRLSQRRAAEIVGAVLQAGMDGDRAPARARERAPVLVRLLVAALLLVLLAGASLAAVYLVRRQARPATAPMPAQAPASISLPASSPVAPSVSSPASGPAPAAATAPAIAAPPTASAPARPAPVHIHSPEDLLQLANQRRGARRFREADALYQRVLQRHPGTPASYVAQLASAALRLEHLRDPRGARRLYEAALRTHPAGALSEEARLGLAESCRALQARDAEAQALRDLISAHPGSLHRRQAEARLRALQAPP
jgi:tetratricopeptide (TPR) repeat protein